MLRSYILGADGEPVECDDLAAVYADYGRRDREDPRWRYLRVTKIHDAAATPCLVSTCFLGLSDRPKTRPPHIFETLVFGGERDGQSRRWANRDEALRGHDNLVALIATEAATAAGIDEEDQ